ncbi:MAG: multiheme c-type cytochrome [Trichloromonadaceae bacterium]
MSSLLTALGLLLLGMQPAQVQGAEGCLDCHRSATPAAVRQWQRSAHAEKVGYADCHGSDHAAILAGDAKVTASVCGRCHVEALAQHQSSRHGKGLQSGWGCTRNLSQRLPAECRGCHQEGSSLPTTPVACARFLQQSPEMGNLGCNRCHEVETSCASCHSSHTTDLAIVRNPNVCAKCHMGPDHAQWEMWQTSQHGTLYQSAGAELAPSCQSCHLPAGGHNVSQGLTMTPGGDPLPPAAQALGRQQMLQVCRSCHSEAFARRELDQADAVRSQSLALVKQAEALIWDLADRGWLDPAPSERPPHPLKGAVLVTDQQMLYENTSRIEGLFFRLKKYALAQTVKGAYHQNPAYTHWYGNAELKLLLQDIDAEARRLRERAEGAGEVGAQSAPPESLTQALQRLQNQHQRGALSDKDYAQEKTRLLEQLPRNRIE